MLVLVAQAVGQAAANQRHLNRSLQRAGHGELSLVLEAVELSEIRVGHIQIRDAGAGYRVLQAALVVWTVRLLC